MFFSFKKVIFNNLNKISSLNNNFIKTTNNLTNNICNNFIRFNAVNFNQTRGMAQYGSEYQPSVLKRKRMFGFLRRLRTVGGRKILKRRMLKGRKNLSW